MIDEQKRKVVFSETRNADQDQRREELPDFLKGLAAVLVVFGHCIQWASGSNWIGGGCYFDDPLFKVIYGFHMPLFSFVSGYLFLGSICRHPRNILARKARSLLLPVVFWVTAEMLLDFIVQAMVGDLSLFAWVKSYVHKVLESFWFLWAMFWCSAIVTLVEKVFGGRWYVYVAVLVLSLVWPDSFNLAYVSYMLPFFLAGYQLKKHHFSMDKIGLRFSVVCFALTAGTYAAVAMFAWDRNAYIYVSGTSLLMAFSPLDQFGFDALRILQGFLGVVAATTGLSLLREIVACDALNRVLTSLGKASLVVYILNVYTNHALPMLPIQAPSPLVWVFLSAVLLLVYWSAYRLFARMPWVSFLAFGGAMPSKGCSCL